MTTPTPLFVLRGHRSPIHTLAFHVAPAADILAGGGKDASSAAPSTAAAAAAANVAASSAVAIARPAASAAYASAPPALLLSGDALGTVHLWNLSTRRSVACIAAHPGHPVLALCTLRDGRLLTQGKDGTVKLWDLRAAVVGRPASSPAPSPLTPLRTYETHSYTFFKMQLLELNGRQLLLLPCEESSNLALIDLTDPSQTVRNPLQLIECEARIPRNERLEEEFFARMDEKEAREMAALLKERPPQYERKVGIVMAAKFFLRNDAAASASTDAASASTPASAASSSSRALPDVRIAWATEGGFMGVWDVRSAKHLFQQSMYKDTILSFDLNLSGSYGVICSSAADIRALRIDCKELRVEELGRVAVPHEGLAEVVLRDDCRLFASAGWDHRVRLFDSCTLAPLAVLREHTSTVQCVALAGRSSVSVGDASSLTRQSGLLASGAKDGKVAVYQLYADESASDNARSGDVAEKHRAIFAQRHAQAQLAHDAALLPSAQPD